MTRTWGVELDQDILGDVSDDLVEVVGGEGDDVGGGDLQAGARSGLLVHKLDNVLSTATGVVAKHYESQAWAERALQTPRQWWSPWGRT